MKAKFDNDRTDLKKNELTFYFPSHYFKDPQIGQKFRVHDKKSQQVVILNSTIGPFNPMSSMQKQICESVTRSRHLVLNE